MSQKLGSVCPCSPPGILPTWRQALQRGSTHLSWCQEKAVLALPSWPAGLQPQTDVDGNNPLISHPRAKHCMTAVRETLCPTVPAG